MPNKSCPILYSKLRYLSPRSLDPYYIVNYYIEWVTTSWTNSTVCSVLTVCMNHYKTRNSCMAGMGDFIFSAYNLSLRGVDKIEDSKTISACTALISWQLRTR